MIKKVIIPAAGLGTRFLPITKSFAKEMLPIIDKPNLQYLLEECKAAGIEEIILVVSKEKYEILDYFSHNKDLEKRLLETGKEKEYKLVYELGEMMKITFVVQKVPNGLGEAIKICEKAVGGDDFGIILGDDLVDSKNPAILQLINEYNKHNCSVIGVQKVPHEDTKKYGVIEIKNKLSEKLFEVQNFVEKPNVEDAPSDYAMVGRYVFKNSIFEDLNKISRGKGNEYQLTDAMQMLLEKQKVLALDFDGQRYDIGSKEGYVKAIIDYALEREDLKENISKYIAEKVGK